MGTLKQTPDGASRVRIDTSHRNGVLSVEVTGEMDAASVLRLRRTIESLAAAGDVIRIKLDGVGTVGTSELGALLRMHQRSVARGWRVTWIGLPRLLLDATERFGIPGAVAAFLGASLSVASHAGVPGPFEHEVRDET